MMTDRPLRASGSALNVSQVRLRALGVDEARQLLAGRAAPPAGLRWHEEYPMTETVEVLGMIVAAHRYAGWSSERAPSWWLHQILLSHPLLSETLLSDPLLSETVVGDVGFHGPPPRTGPVEVEIGYNVVPALRGQGIATQACRLLLAQAWRDGADSVTAETEADNVGSRQVLLRSGFADLGNCRFRVSRPVGAGA